MDKKSYEKRVSQLKSDLKTTQDLLEAIHYATHLEGMATYAPLKRRLAENGRTHPDYPILLNENERLSLVREFFKNYESIRKTANRPLVERDFEVMTLMSDKKRLWYIAGAHMAQVIDEHFGRDSLVETIREGPKSFFERYNECRIQ